MAGVDRPGTTGAAGAVAALVLACVLWGASFPVMRAIGIAWSDLAPGSSTWAASALIVTARFTLAALVLACWQGRRLAAATRAAWLQGAGLGAVTAGGIVLQMDGLAHCDASVSAFLTQAYLAVLPLWPSTQARRSRGREALAAIAVLIGIAVLARLDWRRLALGRGEAETLAAAVLFGLQILWIERPRFAATDRVLVTTIMCATAAVATLPLAVALAPPSAQLAAAAHSGLVVGGLAFLTLGATVAAFLLMTRYQPRVGATAAALVYASEPVFATLFAAVLPGLLATWSGIAYADETLTVHLALGGALILGANLLVHLRR